MGTIRTHYDNLKVARDAPIEVIKAAYRSLALKHHPDQNGHSDEAARIMRILNASYEVLSNPETRRQHDEWIKESEARDNAFQESSYNKPPHTPASSVTPPVTTNHTHQTQETNNKGIGRGLYFLMAFGSSIFLLINQSSEQASEPNWLYIISGHMIIAAMRFRNIGYNPWNIWVALIPIVNFVVLYRLLFYPAGYRQRGK